MLEETIETGIVSKYFFYLTIINTIAAIIITLPILVPTSGLPLIVGFFPGTWLLISYLSFLIVGVARMALWCFFYYILGNSFNKLHTNKVFAISQIVIIELSVFGYSITMAAVGWMGGQALRQGLSVAAVGYLIEPLVLPTGVFVSLVVIGQLIGIVNVLLTLKNN